MQTNFLRWIGDEEGFSFIKDVPWVLDCSTKSVALQIESVNRQRSYHRNAILGMLMGNRQEMPFLTIKVRREHILRDSLIELRQHRDDLKKELHVEFIGEEGIDAGGVRKEWFQLLIREIFDANYGMFLYDEETRMFWFNQHSFESGPTFELIGMLLGVALYNHVILDVHFPLVVYKKLSNAPVGLHDLKDLNPALGHGLEQLLEFDGDVEDTFQRGFQITNDVFGEKVTVDLKSGGGEIPLTNDNRKEYVDLYGDYVLNKSVERQFQPFYDAFHRAVGGSGLQLFAAEELELAICGSRKLDFEALERATRYDNGYSAEHPAIRWFWEIVHSMKEEEKAKLLFFTTGSDRAPIHGLGKMKFIIARNGGDTDRLPTSHTCFNVLLLNEYSSKEKMRKALLTAIQNAEGFGLK